MSIKFINLIEKYLLSLLICFSIFLLLLQVFIPNQLIRSISISLNIGLLLFLLFLNLKRKELNNKFLIKTVLIFNIFILLYKSVFFDFQSYLFPFDFYKPGMTFGHFADFFFLFNSSLVDNGLMYTGYLPLSIFLFKYFGELINWSVGMAPNLVDVYIYTLLIIFSYLIVITIFIKKYNKNYDPLIIYTLILTSYIFLYSYERGNPSFISMLFFSLFLYFRLNAKGNDHYLRLALFFMALLISLKMINAVFLYVVFRENKKWFIQVIFASALIGLTAALVLNGINLSETLEMLRQPLLAALQGRVNFGDAAAALGTSSFNAAYLFFAKLALPLSSDGITLGGDARKLFMAIGIIALLLYNFLNKPDLIKDSLAIILVPLFFHASNGDYNLQLLIPIYLFIVLSDESKYSNVIFYLSLLLLLISMFPISLINCCEHPERFTFLTIKALIFPVAILLAFNSLFRIKAEESCG